MTSLTLQQSHEVAKATTHVKDPSKWRKAPSAQTMGRNFCVSHTLRSGMGSTELEAARAAQLRYVTDSRPGIRRRAAGTGFVYLEPEDSPVEDQSVLTRIRSLAIPPAWTEVWICRLSHGHLQASGRDVRGRKQYRYHARWRKIRDESKFDRMLQFGAALPRIRERVEEDLRLARLTREKVLAIVVRLLETTFIRVGNEEYARTNKSFGLTTLKDRHVKIKGAKILFRFRGKSGKDHQITLANRKLARLVKSCQDLPGQDLFQYIDEEGQPQPIDSAAVNEYLRQIAADDFTAKDFRTWSGTLLAAQRLDDYPSVESVASGKAACVSAVADVAQRLGNTPAICRKCYVHPQVLEAFLDERKLARWSKAFAAADGRSDRPRHELALLRYLAAAA
jgi:DNA topoisomerase I